MKIRSHHVRFRPAYSAALLLACGAFTLQACGNEDRAALELQADAAEDGQESDDTQIVEVDVRTDIEEAVVDVFTEDIRPDPVDGRENAPDLVPENFVDTADPPPVVCPEISITCVDRLTGEPVLSGASLPLRHSTVDPECTATTTRLGTTPTEVRWEELATESGQKYSSPTTRLTQPFRPSSSTVGRYELRLVIDYPELLCSSEPFVLNYDAPKGFYTELSWDDGLDRGPEYPSRTDADVHLVRDTSCAEDSRGDLNFRTRTAQLDWGILGETSDNPRMLYDDISSPGYEAAWIETPSEGQIVHYLVQGWNIDPELDGAPLEIRYRVFIEGALVADATASVGLKEYIVLGAYNDGVWAESAPEFEWSAVVCPVLVAP